MNCIFCGSENFILLGTEWDTDLGQAMEIWMCDGCQRTHGTPADGSFPDDDDVLPDDDVIDVGEDWRR